MDFLTFKTEDNEDTFNVKHGWVKRYVIDAGIPQEDELDFILRRLHAKSVLAILEQFSDPNFFKKLFEDLSLKHTVPRNKSVMFTLLREEITKALHKRMGVTTETEGLSASERKTKQSISAFSMHLAFIFIDIGVVTPEETHIYFENSIDSDRDYDESILLEGLSKYALQKLDLSRNDFIDRFKLWESGLSIKEQRLIPVSVISMYLSRYYEGVKLQLSGHITGIGNVATGLGVVEAIKLGLIPDGDLIGHAAYSKLINTYDFQYFLDERKAKRFSVDRFGGKKAQDITKLEMKDALDDLSKYLEKMFNFMPVLNILKHTTLRVVHASDDDRFTVAIVLWKKSADYTGIRDAKIGQYRLKDGSAVFAPGKVVENDAFGKPTVMFESMIDHLRDLTVEEAKLVLKNVKRHENDKVFGEGIKPEVTPMLISNLSPVEIKLLSASLATDISFTQSGETHYLATYSPSNPFKVMKEQMVGQVSIEMNKALKTDKPIDVLISYRGDDHDGLPISIMTQRPSIDETGRKIYEDVLNFAEIVEIPYLASKSDEDELIKFRDRHSKFMCNVHGVGATEEERNNSYEFIIEMAYSGFGNFELFVPKVINIGGMNEMLSAIVQIEEALDIHPRFKKLIDNGKALLIRSMLKDIPTTIRSDNHKELIIARKRDRYLINGMLTLKKAQITGELFDDWNSTTRKKLWTWFEDFDEVQLRLSTMDLTEKLL